MDIKPSHPPQKRLVTCPVWHSPLYAIVAGGIEARCKSCRGEVHFYSREEIERIWDELDPPSFHTSGQISS